jgi:site-specific DNA-methyltransferase (adenine-specific)/adenine-specific DNA-methyltransferase
MNKNYSNLSKDELITRLEKIEEKETQKEYELVYAGKAREEDIIADTLAAPLQEVRTFNSDNKFEDNWTNRLIFGDNILALKNLYEDPNIKGKVKLIYIDPPFATKQDFMKDEEKAYRDKIIGSKFLEFTRKRVVFLKELLSPDGSLYIHLDQKKGHYIKVLLDEIFEESNFQNEIIWSYRTGGSGKGNWSQKHDSIYFYSKTNEPLFNLQKEKAYTKSKSRKAGIIDYGGGTAEFFEDEYGVYNWVNARDVWDIPYINSQAAERLEYPTQKPELLLEKIIKASSNKGDIILDAFSGSGTTLAVAEKLKRKWIGIDCGKLAIYTIQKRMLNLREEIGNKGNPLNAKAFTLYNSGLYDWTEIKKLDFTDYRDFVLKLFQVREEEHKVRGIELDGYIGNDNAYLWNHTKEKRAKLDLDFIRSLHEAIGGKGGEVFYVIAPTNAFAFYQDEIKFDDTTYKTLRIPESVIRELINRMKDGGDALRQPTSEQDVNDTIDAVGFDFIQVPETATEYKTSKPKKADLFNKDNIECVIKLNKFKSKTLTKSPEEFENYETLSMVMIDYNYDGKVFDLDEVFYADQIKPDYEVCFDKSKLDKQMMVIYLDIYGNEKKEILTIKDFKK